MRITCQVKNEQVTGQIFTAYLRSSKMPTGLLINFHVARLRDGIKRIAN
jgi:hypothetical protein